MESSSPELPQEIINAVVEDYVIQNDSKALGTLGLVSRAWSHPTREHLFRAITIVISSFPGLQGRLEGLELLLQGRPLLSQYIKSLTMDVDGACQFAYATVSDGTEADLRHHYMWMDCQIEFPSLLTSLRHVSVGGTSTNSFHSPRYVPHSFERALQALFARPHVTSISLNHIEIDLIPFAQYHHIEKLSLRGISTPAWSRPQACCFPMNRPPTTSPGCLQSLDLSLLYAPVWEVLTLCCASPEATLSIGKIKDLTITTGENAYITVLNPVTAEQWDTIFNTYGRNVESYTLRQTSYRDFSPVFIPLRSFPNLNRLSIELTHEECSDYTQTMPSLVKALEELSQLDKPINITSIHVKYRGCGQFIKLEFFSNQEERGLWAQLDGALEGPAFSSLKEVVFAFQVYCCKSYLKPTENDGSNPFADMCRTQYFPSLNRRGLLTLRFFE